MIIYYLFCVVSATVLNLLLFVAATLEVQMEMVTAAPTPETKMVYQTEIAIMATATVSEL